MLKIINNLKNRFELVLDGEIKVDHNKIPSYDNFVENEKRMQIKEQILEYLKNTFQNPYGMYVSTYREYYGYNMALKDISNFLSEKIEL